MFYKKAKYTVIEIATFPQSLTIASNDHNFSLPIMYTDI